MNTININRLVKDIKNITTDPIEDIYYKHDEENILKGYALIIGPKNTPYEYGYYLFEFTFLEKYPFLPPIVKFFTNDNQTRFNPNYYICGKVCLSILNTWKGEGWSSCQNIRSILLTLQCTLNSNPICNEPGITELHKDNNNYNNMLRYKNLEIAIFEILTKNYLDKRFDIFFDIIIEHYLKNRINILKNLDNLKNDLNDNTKYKFNLYASDYLVNFNRLLKLSEKVDKLYYKSNLILN